MSSPYLTEREIDGVSLMRKALGERIPEELNTDFMLARWWRHHDGKLPEITPHLLKYIENRSVFDRPDFEETVLDDTIHKKYLPYLSLSKLGAKGWSESANATVEIEKAIVHPKSWTKTIPTYDNAHMAFARSVYAQKMVLKKEAETGKPAGLIYIYDMNEFFKMEWLNPLAAHVTNLRICVNIWLEFFPELVKKIIIVNPPQPFGVFWYVMSFFLSKEKQQIIHIANTRADVAKLVDPALLPALYGGKFKNISGFGDEESCCSVRKEMTEDAFYKIGAVWKEIDLKTEPELIKKKIRPHEIFRLEQKVSTSGTKLAWQFWVNGEIIFGVKLEAEETTKLVLPRLPLATPKLPEERILFCEVPGLYVLEFENTSSYFQVKLDYAICVAE